MRLSEASESHMPKVRERIKISIRINHTFNLAVYRAI
jgi:hypothetical protein